MGDDCVEDEVGFVSMFVCCVVNCVGLVWCCVCDCFVNGLMVMSDDC